MAKKFYLLFVIILFQIFVITNNVSAWDTTLNPNLVSYWDFDENTGTLSVDKHMGINNVTLTDGATWGTGKINSSLSLDGSNDYGAISKPAPTLEPETLAISLWFKTSDTSGMIFKDRYSAWGLGLDIGWGSAKLYVAVHDDSTTERKVVSTGTYADGNWHHVILNYNGTNMSVYVDGGIIGSIATTGGMYYNSDGLPISFGRAGTSDFLAGDIDEVGFWNNSLSDAQISLLWNGGSGIGYDKNAPQITLTQNVPANNYSTTNTNITFNCTATAPDLITSISLNTSQGTTTVTGSAVTLSVQTSYVFSQGDYLWNCSAISSSTSSASSNRVFNVDTTNPSVTGSNFTNLYGLSSGLNSSWWFNATDTHLSRCWYYTSDNSTNSSITCNSAKILTTWLTQGTKTLYFCANDTAGNVACSQGSLNVLFFPYQHSADKTFVGENGELTFTLQVNGTDINTLFPVTNATLWFNNTLYYPDTETRTAQNYTIFERSLTIPEGWGNGTGVPKNFYWIYHVSNSSLLLLNQTTDTKSVSILDVQITDCLVTSGTTILNLTLKDEELNSLVNITSPNINNIEIDMNISSWTNSSISWTFSKQWSGNNSVAVCIPSGLLNSTTYRIDFTIGFDSTDHVREFYYLENGTLDNTQYFNPYTSHSINLMDLLTADSTTFLFEYTNELGVNIENAMIHVYRKYIGEGLFREVERSKEDNNGQTHVHLVEEDVIYYFMVSQYGKIIYTSDQYNAKCLSEPCSISLSASPSTINWTIADTEGGRYQVSSNQQTRMITVTYALPEVSLVNVSLYKFINGTVYYVNTSSATGLSGSITLFAPITYGNSTYFVDVYRDNVYVKSFTVNLREDSQTYFGNFGLVLVAVLVLALMLMALTEGAGFILFTVLALFIASILNLINLGYVALVSIACAGGIIVWKLVSRRNKPV